MAAVRKNTAAFVQTEVDEEVVLVSLDRGELYSLKGTGLAIWEAIDGERPCDEIAADLAQSFAGDPVNIGLEVEAFLKRMVKLGFLEANPPRSST